MLLRIYRPVHEGWEGWARLSAWVQGNLASVMEYVPGGSLRSGLQKLHRSCGASERLRACIALQAARGKTAMHPPKPLRDSMF